MTLTKWRNYDLIITQFKIMKRKDVQVSYYWSLINLEERLREYLKSELIMDISVWMNSKFWPNRIPEYYSYAMFARYPTIRIIWTIRSNTDGYWKPVKSSPYLVLEFVCWCEVAPVCEVAWAVSGATVMCCWFSRSQTDECRDRTTEMCGEAVTAPEWCVVVAVRCH